MTVSRRAALPDRLAGRALLLLALVAAPAVSRHAAAQTRGFDGDLAEQVVSRPHTIAELEAGIIALPSAPISPSHQGGSTPIGPILKGDATVMTGIHILYRSSRDWAFGAGALLGPNPTSENIGTKSLSITHSRSYLWVGAEGRYIPLHYKWVEAWVGATAGGIVVADRFDNNTPPPVPPIVGINEVTVRTEGFSVGLQVGVSWMFAESFVVGFAVRYDRWVLPNFQSNSPSQECSPVLECPTLSGSLGAFEGGLTIGYRIPL
jgi:hypothetical protein